MAKLTPHGPSHAPRSLFTIVNHLSGAMSPAGTGATLLVEGLPDNSLSMSASGPLGPSFLGVWQSLQPPTVVRYFPRCTGVCAGASAALVSALFVSVAGCWQPP